MKAGNGKKVLVAMSGGVDSSVTAALLQQEGYDVVGCFMRLGSDDSIEAAEPDELACDPTKVRPGKQGCCSLNDASDARFVAAMLDIPFYVMNFKRDFGRIMDYFVDEYNAGRTPNPCVRCNDWLKFGKLWSYAKSIDADYVATGHYARVEHKAGPPGGSSGGSRSRLLQGKDPRKDQSYVLFGTRRENLEHMLLPVGEYEKPEVRKMAEELDLPVFDKPDSQEICFVPDNDYARLVKRRTPEAVKPGKIVDEQGNEVGNHEGHQHFTIGQRRGLGMAFGYPIYVVNKDADANTVTVGRKESLAATGLTADQTNWLIDAADVPTEAAPRRCTVKIRYNSRPAPATVWATGEDTLAVRFDEPLQAVSPGQAVVCYDGDEVIGGGWIDQAVGE